MDIVSTSEKWVRLAVSKSRKKLSKTSLTRKFWLSIDFNTKVKYLGIKPFVQFLSLKWRNGPQNWNVCEKLSKIGHSWKFWLLVRIYAKVNFLEIGRLCNFWVSNEEIEPKIGMYSKNLVWQVRFENFDFLSKSKDGTKI